MYFDDAMIFLPTGIDDPEEFTDPDLLIYPNPVISLGIVTFFLQSPSHAELNIYSSDGSLAVNLFSGHCGSGPQTVEWNPPATMPPGVYTIRLSLRREGTAGWQHTARRWVVIK